MMKKRVFTSMPQNQNKYAMATAGALPNPAVQCTYALPFPSEIAHSNDETAFGNPFLKESGSKSLACKHMEQNR